MTAASRRPGYTLMEIVVVLGILAVLLSMGLMYTARAKANRELDSAAMEMVNALKYARQMAISSGGTTVTFTPASAFYIITQTTGGQVLKRITIPPSTTMTIPNAMNPLLFSANGSTNAGGDITVTSSSTGRAGTVNVQQVAGTASVSIK